MLKILRLLLLALLHLFSLSVLAYILYPLASWYFSHRPILGIDFYNTATFARFLSTSFEILPRSYLDFWFAGSPLYSYAVMSWFYPLALLSRVLPLISAIKLAMIGSIFLQGAFVYLGCHRLSKQNVFSLVVAVLVIASANLYGSLTWGGSLPYFLNQIYLPLMLWLLASYLETNQKSWYFLSILVFGLALNGHVGSSAGFMLPSALLLLFLGFRKTYIGPKQRLLECGIFFIVACLIAYSISESFFLGTALSVITGILKQPLGSEITQGALNIDTGGASSIAQDIAAHQKSLFQLVFTHTHYLLFVTLIITMILALVALFLGKERRKIISVLAWVLICLYGIGYVFLNAQGVHLLFQGWYRSFWHVPIFLSFLAAAFLGFAQNALVVRAPKIKYPILLIFSSIFLVLGFVFYTTHGMEKTIALVDQGSSPSSAHPEALNLVRNQEELDALKKLLVPEWLPVTEKNYRMFTSDAQVNVWWNAVFDLPLARGYLDAPGNPGQHFLLDQSVGGDDIVRNFDYPDYIAQNMAFYYLDWYAVKYAEGGHLSKSANKAPSSYLRDFIDREAEVSVPGAYILYQTKSGKPEIDENVPQYLKYYEFSDDITSPVITGVTSPVIMCLCDWATHESFTKILSMHDLNTRFIVNTYSERPVDSFSVAELKKFDGLFLSNYTYKNRTKAYKVLAEYVKEGGKILIDTGSEMKDAEGGNMPEIFPFQRSERNGLGEEWDIEYNAENPIFTDVDFAGFAPPVYESDEWKFSYPTEEIAEEAEVLLKQRGKPILIHKSLGKGTVLWSGMNLAYHVQYNTNEAESILFISLLKSLVPLEEKELVLGKITHNSPRNISFTTDQPVKGVVAKYHIYKGWKATVNGRGAHLYAAGPAAPGFIYIPISTEEPIEVRLSYQGQVGWYVQWFVMVGIILLILDVSFCKGFFIGRRLLSLFHIHSKKLGKWWQKDENE